MKKSIILLSAILVITSSFITSCSDDAGPSKEDKFIKKLRFTWNLEEVEVNGKDVTNSFPDLTLTVNKNKTYTVANPVSPIWPATGHFELEKIPSSDLYKMIREDGVVITITELTETTLKYTLSYTASGGKAGSISGEYEFSMSK